MKIKVSELSGLALDWAVAKCEGHLEGGFFAPVQLEGNTLKNYAGELDPYTDDLPDYSPSTNWAQGGPIIEREIVSLDAENGKRRWKACAWRSDLDPLIAALRCYVSSKLGDVVEVPDELYNP